MSKNIELEDRIEEITNQFTQPGTKYLKDLNEELLDLFEARQDGLIKEIEAKLPEKQPMQATPSIEPEISLAKQEGFNKCLEAVIELLSGYRRPA